MGVPHSGRSLFRPGHSRFAGGFRGCGIGRPRSGAVTSPAGTVALRSAAMPSRRATEERTLARLSTSPSIAAVATASFDQTFSSTGAKSVAPIASALPNIRPLSRRARFQKVIGSRNHSESPQVAADVSGRFKGLKFVPSAPVMTIRSMNPITSAFCSSVKAAVSSRFSSARPSETNIHCPWSSRWVSGDTRRESTNILIGRAAGVGWVRRFLP